MASVVKTLRGGPHNKLKLKFPSKDNLPEAFYYDRESELGIYAPEAIYVLRKVEQKNRTITVYEYAENYEKPVLEYDMYAEILRIYNRTPI